MDTLKNKFVLILDDERDLCELLKEEFESAGATVTVCRSLKDARTEIGKTRFHAVLSDVNLPDGNGISLLEDLKKLGELPHVYYFTGKSDLSSEKVMEAGALGVFSKPCKIENIIEAIGLSFLPDEQRIRQGRISVRPPITIEIFFDGFDDPIPAQLINIGKKGMFIAIDSTLPYVGQAITFKTSVDSNNGGPTAFEGKAVCKWVRVKEVSKFPRGFGVEFSELSPSALDFLQLVAHRFPEREVELTD